LADLGLLSHDGRNDALFRFLDRTLTDGGRGTLRRMLSHPLRSVKEIQQRQLLLRELAKHIDTTGFRDLAQLIERVQSYIGSPFTVLPSKALSRLTLRLRYTHILDSLSEGISAVAELLEIARLVGDLLETFPLDLKEGHDLAREIRDCIELPVFVDLRRAHKKAGADRRGFARFDARIRGDRKPIPALRAAIDALHHADALRALAVVSMKPGWSFPQFIESDTPVFHADELTHPSLDHAVPSTVALTGSANVLYVTGPYMAGKTTFMKACALTVRDSLANGESFFLAEVRRIKKLVSRVASGERLFSVIDEMFKGTNVLDASDATKLIVVGLSAIPGSVHVIASHITDFVPTIADAGGVQFSCFDGKAVDATLTFSYRLQPGVSTNRLGLQLLASEGVVALLDEAQRRTGALL
jgi:DNA mismatch repair ATPase MutS